MSFDQQNHNFSSAQDTFRETLKSLVYQIGNCPEVLELFPLNIRDDILKLQLTPEPPWRGGLYDVTLFQRKISLSVKLLRAFNNYWETCQSSDRQRRLMCQLYFLHELHHPEQKVDSDTYPFTPGSLNIFMPLDYTADAFAVKCSYLLDIASRHDSAGAQANWNELLAEILDAHIRGGEVFSYAEEGRAPELLDGERLHRQLIWHLQYARARLFKPEASFAAYSVKK